MNTRKRAWIAVPLVCLAILLSPSHPAAQPQMVPFKVFITELWQLDVNQDPGFGPIGDFYAKITINGVEHNNKGACGDGIFGGILVPFPLFKNFTKIDECSAKTPWAFTQQVPAGQPVHVKIQIFDEDSPFGDDEGDLKVGDGDAIELDVNPTTGIWTGDIDWPQNCSRPNLNLGGNNVNACWQLGFDTDDDGLLDVWEKFGVDTDNDGVVDIDLPRLGANPFRKDVFVELDYLQADTHSHAPTKDAVERIVNAFAAAPVANIDGTTGVQLHIDTGPLFGANATVQLTGPAGVVGSYGDFGGGNAIPEAGNEIIVAFDHGKGDGTKVEDLKRAHFNLLREPIFRYVIFGHQTNARLAASDCTTGVASKTHRDLIVTLGGRGENGSPCWGTDGRGFSVGSDAQRSGAFMHELGHTLGLQHGGDNSVNDKPNYLSVMNYSFWDCKVPPATGRLPGGCDYSRLVLGAILPPLDETDLDECVGLGAALGMGPVDWNGNNIREGRSGCGPIFTNTFADTNNDGVCVAAGPNRRLETKEVGDDQIKETSVNDGKNRFCATTANPGTDDVQQTAVGETPTQPNVLTSFDDWDHVSLSLIDFPAPTGNTTGDDEQEPDPKTTADAKRFLSDLMAPAVTIEQRGPATAKPGDVLTYTVKVTNPGRGPALAAILRERTPDGAETSTDVGTFPVGSELTHATSFTVPASACPGDLSAASASMTFTDFPGQELSAAVTTPLQVLDVAAPSVELVLTPNVLWPPNHKLVEVTATVASTDNCDASPSVTLVSIVSSDPANNKEPDIQDATFGTDDRVFSLRAERDTGHGSTGRVYTVSYRVTDRAGNSTIKTATVTVPANQGGQ